LGDEGFFKVPDDEHQPRAPVGVGPGRQPGRGVEGVLHRVHGHRAVGADAVDQALHAQDALAGELEEGREAVLEGGPLDGRLANHAKARTCGSCLGESGSPARR